jgi:hypothetical protein
MYSCEDFDTRDLKEAKALLEEVASQCFRHHKKFAEACDSFNQRQELPNGSQIEKVPLSRLRAA